MGKIPNYKMGSELEVLKKIWENKGETSVKLISGQTGFGLDYVRYLCNGLIKRGQIKPIKKKPGWYRITAKGEKKLKLLGIFKPKILKEEKGIRKVILPWPKELLKERRLKGKPGSEFLTRFATFGFFSENPVKNLLPGKEIPAEEKKLRLGKMVEKTISFLRASTFFTKGRKRRKSRLQRRRASPKFIWAGGKTRQKIKHSGGRRKKYAKR